MKAILLSFCLLILLSCLLIFFTDAMILTPAFYARSGESLSGIITENINLYANIQRWSYLYEIICCFVQVVLTATLLYTALYIKGLEIKFADVVLVATRAAFIFVLAAGIKMIWFYWQYPHGTLLQWHTVYPLSCLSFFDEVPAAWIYPLQLLNVFEISYWFLLAYGLSRFTALKFDDSLKIVVRAYVPALIFWALCVCFVTVMYFPAQS